MKKKIISMTLAILLLITLSQGVFALSYVATTIYKNSSYTGTISVDQDGIEWKVVSRPNSTFGTYTGASADVILENAWVATRNSNGSAAYVWLGSQGQVDAGLTWNDSGTTGWRAIINCPYYVPGTHDSGWFASPKILPYGHNYNLVYKIFDTGYTYNGISYPYVQLDVYDIGTKANPTWTKVDTLIAATTSRMSNDLVEMASIAYQPTATTSGTYFGGFYFDNVYLYGKYTYGVWDHAKTNYIAKGTLSGRTNQVLYSAQSSSNYVSKVTLDLNYDR